MIAAAMYNPQAGRWETAGKIVLLILAIAVMAVIVWAIMIGASEAERRIGIWWQGRHAPKPEEPTPVRMPTELDPFEVAPQLGGTYHVIDNRTGKVMATSGWMWEAQQQRMALALQWYKERREECR